MHNKALIDSLINKLAIKDPDLMRILEQFSKNLDEVYHAVIDGPLPAVSGERLINLPIPPLPDDLARTSIQNTWTAGQIFNNQVPIQMKSGGGTPFDAIVMNANNHVKLGSTSTPPSIPNPVIAAVPTPSTTSDGIIMVARDTGVFCYFAGNNRYYVVGTPF